MTRRLALVDLSGVFWRAWHATADTELSAAHDTSLTLIHRFVEGFDHVAICCDGPPYWRKELHAEYKAQRERAPELAIAQLRRVEERLALDGFVLWKCQGYEADDVIATAARIAADDGLDVVIGSSDKDMLQLVDDERGITAVSLFNGGTAYNEAAVKSKFGVAPSKLRDLLALVGDKSDNIPGVPGIGPVNAAKLLAQFGSVQAMLMRAGEIQNLRFRELVKTHGQGVQLAWQLVGLKDDAPINFEECKRPRVAKPLGNAEEYDMGSIDNDNDEERSERETEPPSAPSAAPPSPPPSAPEALVSPTPEPPKSQAIQKSAPAELVTAPATSFDLGLQPGSLGAAYKLARGLYESRMFPKLPNAEAIWAIIIRGRELGLGALTALDCMDFYEGKLAFKAHYLIDRATQHPDCEYFMYVDGDETFAEYETKHRKHPRPTRLKYTIAQAELAGLLRVREGKQAGNWHKRPAEMLRKTCGVQLARLVFPGALGGAYSREELEGSETLTAAAA